jgi:pimeloyl-ACP methyl ester carboxylesterase
MIAERELKATEAAATMPADFSDQYVTINNIRLRYWQAGENGSPLLLLHGLNGCVENWRLNIGALAVHHRVFALDGPGHGLSQPDDRSLNLDFMRDLLEAFVHALGLERISVAALSGSGLVALKLALDRPALLDRLVLADVAGLGRGIHPRMRVFTMLPPPPPRLMNRRLSREELRRWVQLAFFANPAKLTDPMLDDFYTNLGRPHTMRTAASLMRWGINIFGQKNTFTGRLRHIKTPTLIVWGQQDKLIPVRHGRRAAQLIPDARLVVFDPCGHLPMLEYPAEFNRAVLEFLGSAQ